MGVKISNLPAIVTPALSDIFPVVQGGVTYKESFTQLSSLFATAGANANITSLSGLTTPLSPAQGGTGITSLGTGVATALGQNVSGAGNIALITNAAWTPVFTFATPGDIAVVYTTQLGYYTVVGNLVTATFFIACTPTYTTSAGAINITGLPFLAANALFVGSLVFAGANALPVGTNSISSLVSSGTQFIRFFATVSGGAGASLSVTNAVTATVITLQGTITYTK